MNLEKLKGPIIWDGGSTKQEVNATRREGVRTLEGNTKQKDHYTIHNT
jgi:hypothetical protein